MSSLNSLPSPEITTKPSAPKSDPPTQLLNLTTHHMRDLAAVELRVLIFLLAHTSAKGQYLLDLACQPKSKAKYIQADAAEARQQLHQELTDKHQCPIVTLADFHKSLGMRPSSVIRILKRLAALRLITPIKQLGPNITLRQLTIPDHPMDEVSFTDSDNDSLDSQQASQLDDLAPLESDDSSQFPELSNLDDAPQPLDPPDDTPPIHHRPILQANSSPGFNERACQTPILSAHAT